MIVSLRGGCGSGKTHIVRAVMAEREMEPVYAPSRRAPVGYVDSTLFVAGHYETTNGGLDTLPHVDYAYELIRDYGICEEMDVLYEGRCMTVDLHHVRGLLEYPFVAVHLTTSLESCVSSVRERGHTMATSRIESAWRKCDRDAVRLEEMGAKVVRAARVSALTFIRENIRCG